MGPFNVLILLKYTYVSQRHTHTHTHTHMHISNTPTVLIIWCGRSGHLQVLDCVITGLLAPLLHPIRLEHTREILKM